MGADGRFGLPPDEPREVKGGSPIPEEEESLPVGKVAGLKKFGGGPPKMPAPADPNDGQIVLASAKYLQRDPEPEARRADQARKRLARAEQEEAGSHHFHRRIFSSESLGVAATFVAAALWYATIYGLHRLFRSLANGE